jgi:hypothetical protein
VIPSRLRNHADRGLRGWRASVIMTSRLSNFHHLPMISYQINLKDRICSNGRLNSAEIDGEIVLMSLEKGRYYSLDDIGSAIFRRLREPVLVSVLCDELALEYRAEPAVVEQDVLDLLRSMLENGLVALMPEDGA